MKRIVHYINQFFGQVGAESEAFYPLTTKEGPVGPGLALKAALAGEDVEIVATLICGDNYYMENQEETEAKIKELLKEYQADLLLAGPAFLAGRYGMACGNVCRLAHEMGLPAVSGMNEENPGADLFRKYGYIVKTGNSARGMREAVGKMAVVVKELLQGKKLEDPKGYDYFPRGYRVTFFTEDNTAKRAVDMLVKKLSGEPFETELPMPKFHYVQPSPAIKDITKAKIAFLTSGGLVPEGNPDRIEACMATRYGVYSLEKDYGGPYVPTSQVVHGGYDPVFANEDGNRVLPVDAGYALQEEGKIGEVFETILVTTGNGMSTTQAAEFGKDFGEKLLAAGVDGVILTST